MARKLAPRMAFALISTLIVVACGNVLVQVEPVNVPNEAVVEVETTVAVTATTTAPGVCDSTFSISSEGVVEDDRLDEISGVAWASADPGVLWVHNDSGDVPRVFAVGLDGQTKSVHELAGAKARDWEDMAISDGVVYIGDIGDNKSKRDAIRIFRFAEPSLDVGGSIEDYDVLEFTYPDGPTDAEGLFVSPAGGLVVVTKDPDGGARFYATPSDLAWDGSQRELEFAGELDLLPIEWVTAADANSDRLVLRTYLNIVAYPWPEGWTLDQVLEQRPCRLEAPREPQGEALALDSDGAYVTVSEGLKSTIYIGRKAR
ncbi:MAG: hypothetical protein KJO36_02305 [Acidimicrobiia bacterium]|nr:hypothetical protein [Acidimicrobiia bacterium]NNL48051.1 hypothetical protein [Acidimicrobiia bacterium]